MTGSACCVYQGQPSAATAVSWCWAEAEEEMPSRRRWSRRWHWGLYHSQQTENFQRQCLSFGHALSSQATRRLQWCFSNGQHICYQEGLPNQHDSQMSTVAALQMPLRGIGTSAAGPNALAIANSDISHDNISLHFKSSHCSVPQQRQGQICVLVVWGENICQKGSKTSAHATSWRAGSFEDNRVGS